MFFQGVELVPAGQTDVIWSQTAASGGHVQLHASSKMGDDKVRRYSESRATMMSSARRRLSAR